MEAEKRIIEINGIKMEVDLRHTTRIDTFKVGDNIKVLVKEYSDYKSFIGTIIGFDNFEKRPTVVIAYLKTGYNSADIAYLYYNSESKDAEIINLNEWDIPVTKSEILKKFNTDIETKQREIKEIENKAHLFETLFGKYFEDIAPTV